MPRIIHCELCDQLMDADDDDAVLFRDPWSNDAIGWAHTVCPPPLTALGKAILTNLIHEETT